MGELVRVLLLRDDVDPNFVDENGDTATTATTKAAPPSTERAVSVRFKDGLPSTTRAFRASDNDAGVYANVVSYLCYDPRWRDVPDRKEDVRSWPQITVGVYALTWACRFGHHEHYPAAFDVLRRRSSPAAVAQARASGFARYVGGVASARLRAIKRTLLSTRGEEDEDMKATGGPSHENEGKMSDLIPFEDLSPPERKTSLHFAVEDLKRIRRKVVEGGVVRLNTPEKTWGQVNESLFRKRAEEYLRSKSVGSLQIRNFEEDGVFDDAVKYAAPQILRALTEFADTNKFLNPDEPHPTTFLTPLALAVVLDEPEKVAILLASKKVDPDPNAWYHGAAMSAFDYAVRSGFVKVVEVFLRSKRIDPNLRSTFRGISETPLQIAAIDNNPEMCDVLLSSKRVDVEALRDFDMSPYEDKKATAFQIAVKRGYSSVVDVFLERGRANVKAARDFDEHGLLHSSKTRWGLRRTSGVVDDAEISHNGWRSYRF